MAFRRQVITRPGRKIDFKQWDAMPSLSAESSSSGTTLGGAISFTIPATILRIRGYCQASLDETKQAGDEMIVGFAVGIVSTDAFNLGVTAVPDPSSEPEYPWLWWGQVFLESFVAAAAEPWGISNQRLEVDSKAMRKVKPGETLCWVAQRNAVAGAPVTILTFGQTRVLIGT